MTRGSIDEGTRPSVPQPVVARPSGEVIAGNTRLRAGLELGMTEVPVVWFEGPDIEAVAHAIADNRTHEFSEWDEPALEELRAEECRDGVGYSDADIEELLAELADDEDGSGTSKTPARGAAGGSRLGGKRSGLNRAIEAARGGVPRPRRERSVAPALSRPGSFQGRGERRALSPFRFRLRRPESHASRCGHCA